MIEQGFLRTTFPALLDDAKNGLIDVDDSTFDNNFTNFETMEETV